MRQVMVLVVVVLLAVPAVRAGAFELGSEIGYESAWQLAWEAAEEGGQPAGEEDFGAWGSQDEPLPAEAQPYEGERGQPSEDDGYYYGDDDYDDEGLAEPAHQEEF